MRQEAEAQAIEVSKRQAKVRESMGNPDLTSKLEAAETKLRELKSNIATLGKEASAAMTAVEAQQQRLTLQRLITMEPPAKEAQARKAPAPTAKKKEESSNDNSDSSYESDDYSDESEDDKPAKTPEKEANIDWNEEMEEAEAIPAKAVMIFSYLWKL
ncbi:hypothetical protein MKW98_014500 [Papaver atlanticum]|uniref:Uncharacterized protein n=1 Tax=Papaver atlanticum TaxID=357466 RepID=A0AAD4SKV2_9MAGN|nr:hypothetical protein MKW98_014500 [Papaver atlanticum]